MPASPDAIGRSREKGSRFLRNVTTLPLPELKTPPPTQGGLPVLQCVTPRPRIGREIKVFEHFGARHEPRSAPWVGLRAALFIGIVVTGCDGAIDAPVTVVTPDSQPLSACTAKPQPGPSPIRRLTRQEYDRTLRDLAADTTHPAAEFGAEEEALGFSNNAAALVTSPGLAQKYLAASEAVAKRLSADLTRVKGYACDPAVKGDDACASQFVDAFGTRAFRRALTPDEHRALLGVFATGRTLGAVDAAGQPVLPFIAGIELVIEAALQSPDFLYRTEVAGSSLSDFELASRLSYLLWGSMPDEALLAAATAGHVHQSAEVKTQAERMMLDPKARETVAEFHRQWLDFDRIHNVGKAAAVYPQWSQALPDLMEHETNAFIEQVVFEGEGTWDALLTAPYSVVNAPLAAYYGDPASSQGTAFQKTAIDPARRSGLLTQGSLLTVNAHSNQTSPVHRGKLIREAFLCDVMPPPPKEVVINVPEPTPGSSARERFAQHSSNAACKGCHTLMDPLGFPFEKFDGAGVYRETENGKPIDDSGEITASDVPGAFRGVGGLAAKLTASPRARHCYVKQWFRFGYGRGETAIDACSLEQLDTQFEKSGRNVKQLLLGLTQTDAFLYRSPIDGGAP